VVRIHAGKQKNSDHYSDCQKNHIVGTEFAKGSDMNRFPLAPLAEHFF
jgi:hypothetical protein